MKRMMMIFIALASAVIFSSCESGYSDSAVHNKAYTTSIPMLLNLDNHSLYGTDMGLFYCEANKTPVLLWSESDVRKILKTSYGYFFLTGLGILFSEDLKKFEYRNEGFNIKVIKHYTNDHKYFTRQVQDLKDLEIDPNNPDNLATCSKDAFFYTTNRGISWISMPNPSDIKDAKAIAIYSDPDIRVFFSNPFIGLYYRSLTKDNAWKRINGTIFPANGEYEEIADIKVVQSAGKIKVYGANNFNRPAIYQLMNVNTSSNWTKIYGKNTNFDLCESLFVSGEDLYYVNTKGIQKVDFKNPTNEVYLTELQDKISNYNQEWQTTMNCVMTVKDKAEEYNFSEIWVFLQTKVSRYFDQANDKKGLYVPVWNVNNKGYVSNVLKLMKLSGLNMMVLDMKDDWGYIKFKPSDPFLQGKVKVVGAIDITNFTAWMKSNDIYLVARIVTFKDEVLYKYNSNQYAIKDKNTGEAWKAVYYRKGGGVSYVKEYWVDPYNEEVWKYNLKIASELISNGFDEIQFDYIRFPTDAHNLGDCLYPARDAGMDKESALMSFLSYARENLDAPISIDIYGANGYYRTGARTGQDVELLKNYIDVIAPMFYPSHWNGGFLNSSPSHMRPYRIYYFGNLRNYYIAKKHIVVRPYLQAFKLNGMAENAYYGPQYIKNQVQAVEDSLKQGYTFWNMLDYNVLWGTYSSTYIYRDPDEEKLDKDDIRTLLDR